MISNTDILWLTVLFNPTLKDLITAHRDEVLKVLQPYRSHAVLDDFSKDKVKKEVLDSQKRKPYKGLRDEILGELKALQARVGTKNTATSTSSTARVS